MRNAGRVLPRKLIEEKLYSWDDDVSSNAIEVHVHHLRRKLGSAFIRTVHGIGYTLGTHEAAGKLSLRVRLTLLFAADQRRLGHCQLLWPGNRPPTSWISCSIPSSCCSPAASSAMNFDELHTLAPGADKEKG